MTSTPPSLSVVVPLYNEEDNVAPLVAAVREALGDGSWELLLVDDGSEDRTAAHIHLESRRDVRVRPVRLARHFGQTPALQAGFDLARGRVVVSMDGDLQNDPADIPHLVATLAEGYDLVAGYRAERKDRLLLRRFPSWLANRLLGRVTGVRVRDTGCSLKAYRRELLDRLHLYSDMHRFIPAMAGAMASARIAEVPVRHHPRQHGASKYGLSRVARVLADLLTLRLLTAFRERPLPLFAGAGMAAVLLGLLVGAGDLVWLLAAQRGGLRTVVLPGVALLWFGLGCYLVFLGLVAEVTARPRGSEALHIPLTRAWTDERRP